MLLEDDEAVLENAEVFFFCKMKKRCWKTQKRCWKMGKMLEDEEEGQEDEERMLDNVY